MQCVTIRAYEGRQGPICHYGTVGVCVNLARGNVVSIQHHRVLRPLTLSRFMLGMPAMGLCHRKLYTNGFWLPKNAYYESCPKVVCGLRNGTRKNAKIVIVLTHGHVQIRSGPKRIIR